MSKLDKIAIESAYTRLDELNLAYESIIAEIIDYFTDDPETFYDILEMLDGYNGYLDYDRVYPMEEFNDFFYGRDPLDIATDIFYGHDESGYHDQYGSFHYNEFCPNAAFFGWNGCGHLVSYSERDYSDYLNESTIKDIIDYIYKNCYIDGAPNDLLERAHRIAAEIYDIKDCLSRDSDY